MHYISNSFFIRVGVAHEDLVAKVYDGDFEFARTVADIIDTAAIRSLATKVAAASQVNAMLGIYVGFIGLIRSESSFSPRINGLATHVANRMLIDQRIPFTIPPHYEERVRRYILQGWSNRKILRLALRRFKKLRGRAECDKRLLLKLIR
ncbi:MAG: hypothetical protein EOP04_07125 [Proteobacteria bacterium]|nr:MAG: hypothetical protein EOP04_07125 [Pseudomonadota bacterium]